jgi:hypothetical protein
MNVFIQPVMILYTDNETVNCQDSSYAPFYLFFTGVHMRQKNNFSPMVCWSKQKKTGSAKTPGNKLTRVITG